MLRGSTWPQVGLLETLLMMLLITGLIVFIGAHAIRIVSEDLRSGLVVRLGPLAYKGLISVLSLLGLVLIAKGYAAARANPIELWTAWSGARHVVATLSLVAFVLFVAAYVPKNTLRARLKHPMVIGVKVWALGHLLANHTLADLLLFGSLLAWAVLSFRAARRRDAAAAQAAGATEVAAQSASATAGPSTSRIADAAVIVLGLAAYWVFAFHLHASLIGVRPFG